MQQCSSNVVVSQITDNIRDTLIKSYNVWLHFDIFIHFMVLQLILERPFLWEIF